MYTISNSYHNTETETDYSPEQRYNWDGFTDDEPYAVAEERARCKSELCGFRECTCSNAWGER